MTEGLFILILSVILIASITKPSQNQLPYQIIPLTLAAGVMMVFLFKILKLLCVKFPFFATTRMNLFSFYYISNIIFHKYYSL